MGYIQGEDRSQPQLFPAIREELLDQNNPVRVIDAFVDSLDIAALGIPHARPANTGRPLIIPETCLSSTSAAILTVSAPAAD